MSCIKCGHKTCVSVVWGDDPPLGERTCPMKTKTTIPPSGLAYIREKEFNLLKQRVEALEKLTKEQAETIISFTQHTNALMERIERLENGNTIDKMIEDGEL